MAAASERYRRRYRTVGGFKPLDPLVPMAAPIVTGRSSLRLPRRRARVV